MVWCPGESGDQSVSCVEIGTKVVVEPGENSPCSREMAGFRCFWACWESFVPGEWWIGVGSGRKFSLLGCVVVEPGENSPCSREMAGFRCFWACWESFVPVGPGGGCCWESFVPVEPGGGCCWESFVPGEWWIGGGTGRKFSLLARNGRISLIVGVPGEFCTGRARGRLLRGEFCTG